MASIYIWRVFRVYGKPQLVKSQLVKCVLLCAKIEGDSSKPVDADVADENRVIPHRSSYSTDRTPVNADGASSKSALININKPSPSLVYKQKRVVADLGILMNGKNHKTSRHVKWLIN